VNLSLLGDGLRIPLWRDRMRRQSALTGIGILVAVAFSLMYVVLYPWLVGGFVIYFYPYWPPALAAAYVAGGVLMQAWFCYRQRTAVTPRSLVAQCLTGIGYLFATLLVSGLYQS
jgi:hypothetical protein